MAKSYKLKDDNYIDSSSIMHNHVKLKELLNRGLVKELLSAHSGNDPWTIDMSGYTYGMLYVIYKPDQTSRHNSYVYSFVRFDSSIVLNRMAYTEYSGDATPTISSSGSNINITRATYGGNIEVFFLGK